MIKLAPRLLTAVLTNLMMVGMGNAYDHYKGDVLKQQDVKSSSTVERSLDNIFQDPRESNHGTISTQEQLNEATTAHSAESSPSATSSKSAKTNPPTMSLTSPLKAVVKSYTLDVDFQTGSSININHDDVHDQLQLDSKPEPFNFIWVACSSRGTIVKVDTLTGAILGEYKSAPRTDGNPSRTTVDKDGSVWLSNRKDIGPNVRGTIVHIGLLENNQCEDRNKDNVIQTSTGLGDIKAWAEGGTRGVQFADDECIVHYTEVSSRGTRHLSIDADNNVWVSGSSNKAFDKVKGGRYDNVDAAGKHSGDILESFPSLHGPLQMAQLGRLYAPEEHWHTHGYGMAQGCVVDKNDDVWVAHSSGNSVGHIKNDGTFVGRVTVGSTPTGVAVDKEGKIWATNLSSSTLSRIDPALGQLNEETTTAHSAESSPSATSGKSGKLTKQPTMSPTKAVVKIYTFDVDFDEGSLINVNHDDVHDQLQLDSTSEPFNFIWVACSNRGTVVKVDTVTGTILGEYRSAPRTDGSPSRTTVDKDGSVWLSNRNNIGPNAGNGTIVHIGLLENNQCEDRNGDNVIQTSTGLGDIKPWADANGTRGIQTADDECIVHYTEVSSTGTRHLSIDANNNVWVSGYWNKAFDKVKGGRYDNVDADGKHSGDILESFPSVGFGGYGGLMDPDGFIWSARPLLRWDTSKPLIPGAVNNGDPAGDSIGPLPDGKNWAGQWGGQYYPDSYGLCIDSQGNVWSTEWTGLSSGIHKYKSDGTHIANYTHGFNGAQGCVVGLDDDVWVAHSLWGATVGRIANDGTYKGNVPVGNAPTGVAVDKAGKVWSTNLDSSTLSRIDPTLGIAGQVDLTVDLGPDCNPYNYGDMTGSTNIAPPNTGSWTVMYDYGSVLATWGGMNIEWTAETPGDSSVTVKVRSKEADPWVTVTNGQNLSSLTGQYLHVQVNFSRDTTCDTASPLLKDLSIVLVAPTPSKASKSKSKSQLRTLQPTKQPTSEPDNGHAKEKGEQQEVIR
ncbi:hypothetical protein ACHAWU_005918 [Discostella pseudostelligera]|uniref:Uncharacterized protein n=1 Tax=Discostella pseudostelligera TaxID=259834 RepID=A0ABD3M2F0_9STRA